MKNIIIFILAIYIIKIDANKEGWEHLSITVVLVVYLALQIVKSIKKIKMEIEKKHD